ncbi:subunit CCDC53 of WASH complex domain-containing protein [Phthorimaea operculella]|nr:subunit CCDC53 of WASH complex domain-containing protein [Phthorimaea operculella]
MSNQELSGLDLNKVAALQQKRTLAFVNHFVITTVQFLNNFMKNCEQKLMTFERKLEKVEAAMVLLEARLSSIPEVNTEPETKPEVPQAAQETTSVSADQPDNKLDPPPEVPAEEPKSQTPEPLYPEYDRFVKMVHVGVPLPAVKLKLSTEGLDPDILDKLLGNKS